jgi:acyl-homoserine lactone acylase PvdQ
MNMDTEKVSPSLFNTIMKNFVIETYEDDIGEVADTYIRHSAYNNYYFLLEKFHDLLRDGKSPVFDNRKTENVETIEMTFDRAFIKSMRHLNRRLGPIMEKWKWGAIHRGHYTIPLKEESIISNLFNTVKDTPVRGGNSTLYSGAYSENFKPNLNSSLLGIFFEGESEFHMNFSYSIRPMSKFYYGKFQGEKRIKFNKISEKYKTIIDPVN